MNRYREVLQKIINSDSGVCLNEASDPDCGVCSVCLAKAGLEDESLFERETLRERDALIDMLLEVIEHDCGLLVIDVTVHRGQHPVKMARVDSMALPVYADAIRLLVHYGKLEITREVGRRIIAVRPEPGV